MKLKKHLLVTILVGLAVFVIAFAATAALAGPPEPQVPPPGSERIQLADEDFDGWRYAAYREEKNVVLQITLEDTSPEGLESFRAVNRQMARDLVRQQEILKVSVVLNQPLSLAEFTELVEKYGLHVYGFQVRIIDGRGDRVTLFGSSDGDQLVRKDLLQTMLERVQDQTGDATLLGVTTIDAELSPSGYDVLSKEQVVFLVDLTPGFAEYHMQKQRASLLEADDFVTISAYPVYWYLESNRQAQP
jgi:hypothetical protein